MPQVTQTTGAPVIVAPEHWQQVDFLSDVHLHASAEQTFEAWRSYMNNATCDALFILGDLFEVWVGDDVLANAEHGAFWAECVRVLTDAATRLPVYFMAGNRDFLTGQKLIDSIGMHAIADPTVFSWDDEHWLLSHGDALCTEDVDYQRFRLQVRSPAWIEEFLSKPMADRLTIAQGMRQRSEQIKSSQTQWADVDNACALDWLKKHGCHTLIHGHTHQPNTHVLDNVHRRMVLSDWDAEASPPRLQILRIQRHSGCLCPSTILIDQ